MDILRKSPTLVLGCCSCTSKWSQHSRQIHSIGLKSRRAITCRPSICKIYLQDTVMWISKSITTNSHFYNSLRIFSVHNANQQSNARRYGSKSTSNEDNGSIADCYAEFYLDEFCSLEELRQAYEVMLRRSTGDVDRVRHLDKAYYRILRHRYNESSAASTKRSFLHYEGVGDGKPPPQEHTGEQPRGYRPAVTSTKNMSLDKIVNTLVDREYKEDDVTSLSGFGKPLPQRREDPYVDTTQRVLNKILIKHDYTTEWIEIQKEINKRLEHARLKLTKAKHDLEQSGQGQNDLDLKAQGQGLTKNSRGKVKWNRALNEFREEITEINKKVDNFNMAVPVIRMQRMRYDAEEELKNMDTKRKDGQDKQLENTEQNIELRKEIRDKDNLTKDEVTSGIWDRINRLFK